jgi:acetyltransferase-like isoleucine patch superfamily enzyme
MQLCSTVNVLRSPTYLHRYDSFVPELESARLEGRRFSKKYNDWFPEGDDVNTEFLSKGRVEILRGRLGHVSDEEAFIEPPLRVDYGPNISIGKRFYSNFGLTILDSAIVTIGNRVMMGPSVVISTATHEIEVASRRDNIEFAKPVTIGDDCWIGGGVIILAGVTIGNGCTIGAGAIVTRDIPSWSVAVGCPAKVAKRVKELPPVEE